MTSLVEVIIVIIRKICKTSPWPSPVGNAVTECRMCPPGGDLSFPARPTAKTTFKYHRKVTTNIKLE